MSSSSAGTVTQGGRRERRQKADGQPTTEAAAAAAVPAAGPAARVGRTWVSRPIEPDSSSLPAAQSARAVPANSRTKTAASTGAPERVIVLR